MRVVGAVQEVEVGMRMRRRKESRALRRLASSVLVLSLFLCTYAAIVP